MGASFTTIGTNSRDRIGNRVGGDERLPGRPGGLEERVAPERDRPGPHVGHKGLRHVVAGNRPEPLFIAVGQEGADRVRAEGPRRLAGDTPQRLGEIDGRAHRLADAQERLGLAAPDLPLPQEVGPVQGAGRVVRERGQQGDVLAGKDAGSLLERGEDAHHPAPEADRHLQHRPVAELPHDARVAPVRVALHVGRPLRSPGQHHPARAAVGDLPPWHGAHRLLEAVRAAKGQLAVVDQEDRRTVRAEEPTDPLAEEGQQPLEVVLAGQLLQDLSENGLERGPRGRWAGGRLGDGTAAPPGPRPRARRLLPPPLPASTHWAVLCRIARARAEAPSR
jgi:hypothetical protein